MFDPGPVWNSSHNLQLSTTILYKVHDFIAIQSQSVPCLNWLADNIRQNRIKNSDSYQLPACLTQVACDLFFFTKRTLRCKMHQVLLSHRQNVVKHNACYPCPTLQCCKLRRILLFTTPRATSALRTSWPSGQGEAVKLNICYPCRRWSVINYNTTRSLRLLSRLAHNSTTLVHLGRPSNGCKLQHFLLGPVTNVVKHITCSTCCKLEFLTLVALNPTSRLCQNRTILLGSPPKCGYL